jgi:glycosyltransferase involved in cell wall biosynthesis
MNIAVNTRLLIDNNMTGVGWFVFETMQRFVAMHPEHTFYYFFDRPYSQKFITAPNVIPVVVQPKCRFHPVFYKFWYDFQITRMLRKLKIDLFISGDGVMSTTTKVPTILVIHDLAFVHYPHFIPSYMSRYLRRITPKCAQRACHIATVSEYSKSDIIKQYGVSPENISVVYNGTHQMFQPLSKERKEEIRQEYTDGCEYFLFVGTIHPRKNLKNQFLAFDMFKKTNPESKHKFLVVGTTWIWDKEVDAVFANMQHHADVVFIGHLPTSELSELTASATALMYASIFEGFGIPIIEAFESETPVITSNTSSMPEVAGNAALVVDPLNPQSIFEAMHQLANNPELGKTLVEKGRERKKLFSWDITANRFNSVFEETVKKIPCG